MRISIDNGPLDTFRLAAEVEDYDALPPVHEFFMDYWPKSLDPNRVALAGYLLFRPWLSGTLTAPEPVSPVLAQGLAEAETPAWLALQPLQLRAGPIPHGRRLARVLLADQATHDSLAIRGDDAFHLTVLRSDQATGAFRTNSAAAFASNAFVLADEPGRQADVAAAISCLVAQDLDIGDITLPEPLPPADRQRLSRLLDTVGLVLR